jgi:hypothetical protein
MDVLRIIAENKIKEALADGTFDDLEGMGKPLILEPVDPAGDDHFMANHILETNHFLPVWLEDRKQLQQEIIRFLDYVKNDANQSPEKLAAVEQLNKRISGYNLRVPVDSLRLLPVSLPDK